MILNTLKYLDYWHDDNNHRFFVDFNINKFKIHRVPQGEQDSHSPISVVYSIKTTETYKSMKY